MVRYANGSTYHVKPDALEADAQEIARLRKEAEGREREVRRMAARRDDVSASFSAESEELDDVGDFVGKWWGTAAKDERGNMVDTSMEEASVTEDMLRMGRRALQFFRLLPRFPHHRNRYKCTHRGLLMHDDEDARTFVAAFCAACEWYGFVPDERPGTDEQGNEVPGLLREELKHEGVFRYLTSDDFPMPMRDNVEDVYLKSGHVHLFQQSMPEVSDFAQSRRELNGKPLSLAKDGPLSALNLQEDDVLAFADRPLSPLQLGAYVVCVDIGKLQTSGAQDPQDNLLLPFRQEVKCMALDEFDQAKPLLSKLPFGPEWKTDKMPRTNNAKDMMQRLESDLQQSAHDMMQGYAAKMRMLDSRVIANLRKQIEAAKLDRDAISGVQAAQELSRAVSQLDELLAALGEQREKDAQRVMEGTDQLVELANASSVKSGGVRELLRFQCVPCDLHPYPYAPVPLQFPVLTARRVCRRLRRMGGQKAKVHFEFIAAAMVSRTCGADLQRLNPMLEDRASKHELPKACASILLHTIRLCQVNRCIVTGQQLKRDIDRFLLQQLQTQVATLSRQIAEQAVQAQRCGKRPFLKAIICTKT